MATVEQRMRDIEVLEWKGHVLRRERQLTPGCSVSVMCFARRRAR
jgi:hypothetical protein